MKEADEVLKKSLKTEQRLISEREPEYSPNILDTGEKLLMSRTQIQGDKQEVIREKQPASYPAVNDNETAAKKETDIRRNIDKYVRRIVNDRNRMSGYRKVVKAAQLYLDAEKKAERAVALKALLESAKIYLAEGSNKSYGVARKDLCRDLMEVIGEYETVHNEKHGSPALLSGAEYLISGGELSDELVDQEIRIAYAQIKGNKKFLSMSESKRREAFRRKIAEMRLARQLRGEIDSLDEQKTRELNDLVSGDHIDDTATAAPGYAGAVKGCVKNFMSFYQAPQNIIEEQNISAGDMPLELLRALMSGDDTKELNLNKGKVLETMLYQILSWDLNEFAFSKPEDFLKKKKEGKFKELYGKLQFASNAGSLLDELERIGEKKVYQTAITDKQFKELRSRISLLTSVEKEYSTRLELMSSPYYALLLQEDISDLDTKERNLITGADEEKNDTYEESYRRILKLRKQNGAADGAYTRGADMAKLKKAHDKKFAIRGDYRDREGDLLLKAESERIMMSRLKGQKDALEEEKRKIEEKRLADERQRLEEEQRKIREAEDLKKRQEEERKQREAEELRKRQEEEQKQREEAERKKKEEEELRKLDQEARKKREEELRKQREEEQKRQEEERKRREEEERIQRAKDEIKALNERYEALKDEKATDEEAAKVREDIKAQLLKLSGEDAETIEFIPTELLNKLLADHIGSAGTTQIGDKLSEAIDQLLDKFDESYEIIRKPVRELKKKKELNAAERQCLYEYCLDNLYYNSDSEDWKYDSLKEMPAEKLIPLALHLSDYDESSPVANKVDRWSDLSEENVKKHRQAAGAFMAELSGEKAALFTLLPLSELSALTLDTANSLMHPEELQKKLDKYVSRAKQVKDRMDRAKAAAESGEKDAMFAMIGELTGADTALIADIPADRLQEILKDLGEMAAMDSASLESECKERAELVRKDFTEEKLQENFFKYKGEVDKLEEDEKAPVARSGKRDYAVLYLKKMLSVGEKELENYDTDRLYTMAKDFSLIRRLTQWNDPEYEEDLKRSINELYGLDIPQEMKDKMGELLNIKVEKAAIPEQTYEELKGVKADQEYKKNTELFRERKLGEPVFDEKLKMKEQSVEYRKHLEALKESTKSKKKKDAPKTKAAAAAWSKESVSVLNFAGDAVECLMPGTAGQDKAVALQKLFMKNTKLLKAFSEAKLKKKSGDPFTEILKNISNEQRKIFDELRIVVNELVSTCEKSAMSMERFLASDRMTAFCSEAAGKLEGAVAALEAEVVEKMEPVTTNIFDQVEGMGMIPLVDDLDNADATKEEKRREGVRKLDYMQNELLYDRERGQGKFMELLTSGYFKNASPQNRRFMLSYIVKDMQKKTEGGTDAELGGHYFASAMKGAGPLMQKMIQGLPERMVVPEMREAVMVVKSNLRPIDAEYKQQVFERMKKDSKGKIIEINELQSLGAASVAETFLCEVVRKNEQPVKVVIKIKRPDAMQRMQDELSFIRKCSRDADFSYEEQEYLADPQKFEQEYATKHDLKDQKEKKRYNELVNSAKKKDLSIGVTESGFLAQFSAIEKEFDFKNELANAKRGEKNYISNKRHVNTVKIDDSFKADADYIVMNLAEGQTLDTYIRNTRDFVEDTMSVYKNEDTASKEKYVLNAYNVSTYILNRQALVRKLNEAKERQNYVSDLAYQWIKMAIFGSSTLSVNGENFHHGDLHSGNIMISDKGTTVLDYGNATVLVDSKVTQILGMMTAVAANRTDFFVDAFDELLGIAEAEDEKLEGKPGYVGYSRMSLAQKREYEKKLKEIFALGSQKDAGKKILLSLSIAQEMGLKLPREIQNFSQCQQRLENSVLEIKDTAVEIAKTLQNMERITVDPKFKNVPDPVMLLQGMLGVKNEKGEYVYNKSSAYSKVLSQFAVDSADRILESAGKLDGSEEETGKFARSFLPGYPGIKTDSIFNNRAEFAKIKEDFYKVRSYIDKGEAVPEELTKAMESAKQKLSMDMLNSEILTARNEDGAYTGYANEALTEHGGYDVEAFEQLEYMIEDFGPKLLNASEAMDDYLATLKKGGKEKDLEAKKEAFLAAARTMEVANVITSPAMKQLKKNVTGFSTREEESELEAQLSNVVAASFGKIGPFFQDFKRKKKHLESVQDAKDPETLKKARKEYDKALEDFLIAYGNCAVTTLNEHMKCLAESNVDPKLYEDNDYLPDFVTEMGNCLSNHYVRAGGKLGLKYKDEIARLKREAEDQERKEKGIEKTQEQIIADKKADEEYRTNRKNYVAKREAELNRLETAYQEKQKAKAERKKKREEEQLKALANQKSAVEKEAVAKQKDADKYTEKIAKLKEKQKKKGGAKIEAEIKEAIRKETNAKAEVERLNKEADRIGKLIEEKKKK